MYGLDEHLFSHELLHIFGYLLFLHFTNVRITFHEYFQKCE